MAPPRRYSQTASTNSESGPEPGGAPTVREGRWQARTDAVPLRVPEAPEPGSRQRERFTAGAELGRGGMGCVIAATDTLLEREVAIKRALVGDLAGLRRFQREAQITARLEHPAIVPIHDAGTDASGAPFYIMRRIDGEALSAVLARAPDAAARLALVPNVLAAIDAAAFAHAHGIIHRDIKPWNIVIGPYGETLLIDWGLAREIDDPDADVEDAGRACGTPGYMAPEQARAEHLDARSDVYSLGATLLHVLSGLEILPGSKTAWLQRVARGEPPPLDWIDRDVPAELVAIVAKAMAPEPSARYRDGGEMAADLRAFLAGQLVAAHDYTAWQRIAKQIRRHRVAFATGALAALAMIGTGIFAIASIVRERDDATAARDFANDGAELRLVEHASSLAANEPTRAVALLRQLPVTSRHALRARDIAAVAAAHGISHGRHAHTDAVIALEFAPDGHRLLSAAADGTLAIHDLADGTSHTLLRGVDRLYAAVWTDRGSTITYSAKAGVFVLDVARGVTRTIDTRRDVHLLWTLEDDHRVRGHAGTEKVIVELATDGSVHRVIARDAVYAAGLANLVVIDGASGLRVVDERGERVLAPDPDKRFAMMSIADDGSHVAAARLFDGAVEVVEWDVASGRELRKLRGQGVAHTYVGLALYVTDPGSASGLALARDGDRASTVVATGNWHLLWSTRTSRGTAVLNAAGDLAVIESPEVVHRFPTHGSGTRMIAGHPSSPYIAIGSTAGTVWWWDLRTMLPRHIAGAGTSVCSLDRDWIYVLEPMSAKITAVARRSEARRTITLTAPMVACSQLHSGSQFAVATDENRYMIVNGATGDKVRVRAQFLRFVGERLLYVRGRMLFELADRRAHLRWILPADVVWLSATERGVAVSLADGRVAWFDAAGSLPTWSILPRAAPILEGDRDTSWIADGGELSLFERDQVRPIARFDREIDGVRAQSDGSAIVGTTDLAIWRVTRDGHVERRGVGRRTATVLGGLRSAATGDDFQAAKIFLDTGERLAIPTDRVGSILVDDHSLVFAHSLIGLRVDVYDDRGPIVPAALHAWIDDATNAAISPGSDELLWR